MGDNVVYATDKEEEVLEFFGVARKMFEGRSFNLRQWSSNSPKLMQAARTQGVAEDSRAVKVLGFFWDIDRDRLFYNTEFEWDGKFTKRSALRYTCRIFDPNGLLTPITMRKKVFVQKLWSHPVTEKKWDVSFEFIEGMKEEWLELVKETTIAVKRVLKRTALLTENTEIHIFSDANITSYGAGGYARTPPCPQAPNGQVDILCAKGKVAPKKGTPTIPRHELTGVVIAAQMVQYIHKAWPLSDSNKVFIWSDAKVVLNWLGQYNIKNIFVHNRVKTIRDSCIKGKTSIRHVPSEVNPADLITKTQEAKDFIKNEGWFSGPEWLLDQRNWPKDEDNFKIYPLENENLTHVFSNTATEVVEPPILSFFSRVHFQTGLKILAFMLRPLQRVKRIAKPGANNFSKEVVSQEEIGNAKLVAIRVMQRDMFEKEWETLKAGKQVKEGPYRKFEHLIFPHQGDYPTCLCTELFLLSPNEGQIFCMGPPLLVFLLLVFPTPSQTCLFA